MHASVLLAQDFKVIKGFEKQTMKFIAKLTDNPSNPSLKVKPLEVAVDSRVRTARVTDQYRAVLFEFDSEAGRLFVLNRIDNHDEAIAYASKVRVHRNPTNGFFDFVTETSDTSRANIDAEVESRANQLVAKKMAEIQALAESNATSTKTDEEQPRPTPVELPAVPPRETLSEAGVAKQTLANELGLSAVSIEATWRAGSDDDLELLLSGSKPWEKDAILGLLAGLSLDEVREELGLRAPEETPTEAGEPGDEEIVEQLKSTGVIFEASEQELQEIWEEGTFQQWRVYLHHSQQEAVTANHKGSARIVGGAGTGKTVVLVHRAKHLLEAEPNSRILLTTFTRSLANQLKTLMSALDPAYKEASVHGAPGLWISGIDSLIRSVLDNAQKDQLASAMQKALGVEGSFVPRALSGSNEDRARNEAAELHGEGMDPDQLAA